jgi:cytochrome c biogenesis protein CcdA
VGADVSDEELSRRRIADGEHRLPPTAAVAIAIAIYALLPGSLLFLPRIVIPAIEGVLLVALVVTDPRRVTRESRWSRIVSIGLAGLMIVTNLVALGMLIDLLTHPSTQGRSLLLAAMQVWLTNVIGFGLLYWEIDRGGPVVRRKARRDDLPAADWRFANDEDEDAVAEVAASASATCGWIPTFVDYLYLSLTNSSAFSPTDTMPLTTRAKILMGIEATAALFTSLLVIARAVGSIGGGG